MKIKTTLNQTLRDVAVKYYGTYEAIGEILSNNPHLCNTSEGDTLSLDRPIPEGTEIEIDKTSLTEQQNITRELKNYEINTYTDGEKN